MKPTYTKFDTGIGVCPYWLPKVMQSLIPPTCLVQLQ